MIIAVDGSAASGKGTLAKRLALHFDLAHLDTGSLYRALGLHLLTSGVTAENAQENNVAAAVAGLDLGLADSPEIRTDAVAGMASVIAARTRVPFSLPLIRPADGHPRQNPLFGRHWLSVFTLHTVFLACSSSCGGDSSPTT